ncbi:uncharacterized protein F5147DRAFT_658507 [Suillus discolor]|uniref:DUF6533 domain-containing protein n=1 Tax=Suillus discolor TaxID=1912936 RepID=A0A9P7ETX2_9AGAM|nr:uncharacterized protein F5147DRAFT_658507 [Suillus discolor]KAG2089022.1 hypothetical protein F5147DRAFT_658507 [Suillus discolor]
MDAVTMQSVTLDSLHASITLSPSDVLLYLKFVAIASFTILCWDHMITFVDEVDLIWCKHKGLAGYLFLLNQYITPLGFVVKIIGESVLTLPNWPTEVCGFRSKDDWHQTAVKLQKFRQISSSSAMIRVHALYWECRLVIAAIGLLLLVQVAFEAYLMALGKTCHEVYDLPLNVRALSVTQAWLPLAYDTAIFVMTLWRTLPKHRSGISPIDPMLPTFQSNGALYYIIICSANLVLTVMIIQVPPGLKGIAAQSNMTLNEKELQEDYKSEARM